MSDSRPNKPAAGKDATQPPPADRTTAEDRRLEPFVAYPRDGLRSLSNPNGEPVQRRRPTHEAEALKSLVEKLRGQWR